MMNDETTSPEAEISPQTQDSRPKRKRTGRKRTKFASPKSTPWPVRGLWEAAPQEQKEMAHQTCMLILEYWMGKKTKASAAKELGVSSLRVWQLSQQAISGMMAGLLKQPRRRVGPEAFERGAGESRESLQKRIMALEKELARTEDLVRVLRMAPWATARTESGGKEVPKRARSKSRKGRAPGKKAAARRAPADRPSGEGSEAHGPGAGCAGPGPGSDETDAP